MKVVLLVGTETSNSNTSKIALQLQKEIYNKFGDNVVVKKHDQTTINAKNCIGCCNCFKNGICTLKNEDKIEDLKKDMTEADIIYLISPVYFHQISGTMKVFIDRLSYWSHIFKLVGKLGVSVSVSSTNGNEYVDFYLTKFLECLGMISVDKLSIQIDAEDLKQINEKIYKSTDIVYKEYLNRSNLKTSQKQNIYFHQMKSHYENKADGFEKEYWKDNGYFNYLTFEELWKSKMKKY